jgi:predicted acetyltransferase
MEVRSITQGEYEEFRRITKYAFSAPSDLLTYWLSDELDLTTAKAVFQGSQIVSLAQLLPFRVFFGNALIPMGGFSGVATPPEHRRKRYVHNLLHYCLAEMRDKSVPLSYLYPFSFAYYRKFGWEQASVFHLYKIPPDYFHGISEVEGGMELKSPDDTQELNTVYEAFVERYTSACQRDKKYWKMILTPPKPDRFAYLWRNGNGEPRGYIIYENQGKAEGPEPEVTMSRVEWAALDHEARLGIFRFLRDHDSQLKEIVLRTAPNVPVTPYLNNPRCKFEIVAGFMARIVDVKQAFEAKSYPAGLAGKVRFRIKDDFCSWNNRSFTLKIEGGKAKVTSGTSDTDFSTDICCLAAIFTGFWSLRDAYEYGRVHDISPEDILRFSPLFLERIPYLVNFF